jgi:hypothetical protein
MKPVYMLTLLCFSSCTNQNNFIAECINLIEKNVPIEYSFENNNIYTKKIVVNNKDEVFITVITSNNDKIKSCYITFSFSDFIKVRKYHKQLYAFLKKDDWQFIENISKYKRQGGEIYAKEGIYLGIYEQVYYSIPIALSKDKENFYTEGFCD